MGRVKVTFKKKIEIKTLLNTSLSQRKVERLSGMSQECVFGVSNKIYLHPMQQVRAEKEQLR